MNHSQSSHRSRWIWQRPTALLLTASLVAPMMVGCGGNSNQAAAPPLDATRGEAPMAPRGNMQNANNNQGMSKTKKTMIALAGAAALYYMYKKSRDQNNKPLPQGVQYYQSKNGRIYYRDPKTKQAIWVTPPTQQNAFMVPQDELQGMNLQQFQGYNNSNTGRSDFKGLIPMR